MSRSLALGAFALGGAPLAGLRILSVATVALPNFGTLTSGGPNLTVDWTFSQPEGRDQAEYRVVFNDGSTDVYDSGWIESSSTSHVIQFDEEGLSGEVPSGTVTVYARSEELYGSYNPGTDASDAGTITLEWGAPVLTIDAPTEGETINTQRVSWSTTFTDTGHTFERIRVKLLDSGGAVLYDSGWADPNLMINVVPFTLSSFTDYQLNIVAENENGIRSS